HGVQARVPDPGRHPGAAAGRGHRARDRAGGGWAGGAGVNPLDGEAGVRGHRELDLALLDDAEALERNDPGGMLRSTASAGAQVRESASLAAEANLSSIADEGRPRAVVVAGQGTSARTGELLATVAGLRCPVPVIVHRSVGVPGWVNAGDVVI